MWTLLWPPRSRGVQRRSLPQRPDHALRRGGQGAIAVRRQAGSRRRDHALPQTAKALAASEKWDGQLPKLTALDSRDSVAIAQALATRKGPLRLPNLKKISPKTLTALIEKKEVVIPPIESLELILEPDGSVTEDFILPDWLEAWQKGSGLGNPIR